MNSILSLLNNKKIALKLIFTFSLLISSLFLIFLRHLGPVEHEVPGTDYFILYKPMAQTILQGSGNLLQKNSLIVAAPGYPIFFLLPIFALSEISGINELSLIVFFNAVIIAFSVCVLFRITKIMFNQKIALIAAILWASYPLHLWLLKNPNTEVPFLLLFFIAIYLLIRKHPTFSSYFLAGFFLGLAILIRPIALFLPILFAVLTLLFQKNSLRLSALLLAGSLLILTPWIGYASFATGHFVPVASSGHQAILSGLTFAFVRNGEHLKEMPEDVRILMEQVKKAHITRLGNIIKFLFNEANANPIPVIKLLELKLLRSWYATYDMWWEKEIALLQIPYLLTAFAGIALVFKKLKRYTSLYLCLSIVGYFWVMTFLALSIVRYMIPAMAILMIFSAFTLSEIWTSRSKTHKWDTR